MGDDILNRPRENDDNPEVNNDANNERTAIQRCVDNELRHYFELLDGQPPRELHRLVMGQAESALFAYVLEECRGNQSRAAKLLGISRGTLRGKLPQSSLS